MIHWLWNYSKKNPYLSMGIYALLAIPAGFCLPFIGISALSIGMVVGTWLGASFLISGIMGCAREQYKTHQYITILIESDRNSSREFTNAQRLQYINDHPADMELIRLARDPQQLDTSILDALLTLKSENCLNDYSKNLLIKYRTLSVPVSQCISMLKKAGFTLENQEIEKCLDFLVYSKYTGKNKDYIKFMCQILCTYLKEYGNDLFSLLKSRHIKIYFHDLISLKQRTMGTPGYLSCFAKVLDGLILLSKFLSPTAIKKFLNGEPGFEAIIGYQYLISKFDNDSEIINKTKKYLEENRNNSPDAFEWVGKEIYACLTTGRERRQIEADLLTAIQNKKSNDPESSEEEKSLPNQKRRKEGIHLCPHAMMYQPRPSSTDVNESSSDLKDQQIKASTLLKRSRSMPSMRSL